MPPPYEKPEDVLRQREDDPHFYAQVGASVEVWSGIDRFLLRICEALLGTSQAIAVIVYTRTPTLEQRLNLISALVGTRFPMQSGNHQNKTVKKLETLVKEIKERAPFRNDVAHGARLQVTHAYIGGRKPEGSRGFHSVITSSDPKRRKTWITGEDLDRHHDDMWRISMRLLRTCIEIETLIDRIIWKDLLQKDPKNRDRTRYLQLGRRVLPGSNLV